MSVGHDCSTHDNSTWLKSIKVKYIDSLVSTGNVGMDTLLSKGQASVHPGQSCVHGGHTFVQTQSKYLRFLKKQNCQKLKN